MVILVIIIAIILIAIIIVSMRILSFERVVSVQKIEPDSEFTLDLQTEESGDEQPDEEEIVNLVDYFNDGKDPPPNESKQEPESSLEYATTTDKLTDLKRGHSYFVDCARTLASAKDEGHIYCACYFDYDRFSYINSLKGAATGDYVLTNTAQQLRRIFPEGSLVSRISCDHFSVIFPLVDISLFEDYFEQLRHVCDKVRNDIAAKTGMRICVGFATTDNDSSYDVNVLLSRANIARHSAKVTKSEKYETYDETMITSNLYGDALMEDYSECQYGDDLAIYFETQIDLVSDKVIGCDTLVRWTYEDNNAVFITQETGTIPTNNSKVIYQVCRSMSRWRKSGREAVLTFVSVPVTDLFKTDIDEFIGKCLTEFQIDPQMLAVKVDVSAVRLDWPMCSKQFKKFRELGIVICVSGLDTGYSNLDFLSGLSIDLIKLNRSFSHNIDRSPEALEKCRKIIERATAIGARVIFEGVDSIDQVTALRTINAKTIQGRYTGRPATTDDLTRSLPEHIERRSTTDQTVILDDAQLAKGEFPMF